jgi:hypothetical protein
LAWDEGADTINLGHVELAIAETSPEDPKA